MSSVIGFPKQPSLREILREADRSQLDELKKALADFPAQELVIQIVDLVSSGELFMSAVDTATSVTSALPVGFHPGARDTDPITSHLASDAKDHHHSQEDILANVRAEGPGTEEMILTRMGVAQRSSASSEISALVNKSEHLVNLIDPRNQKTIKLRNTSGCKALVRGLPEHQKDFALIQRLLVQMDSEEPKTPKRSKGVRPSPAQNNKQTR
jgi:hypothetical protein